MKEAIQQLFTNSSALKALRVRDIIPLTGDASNRSYSRVALVEDVPGTPDSLILLSYGSAKGPAFRQASLPSQEQALNELARELPLLGIPVPRLYLYDVETRSFVFEDCGDRALALLAGGHRELLVDELFERLGPQWLERLFEQAIDIAIGFQRIAPSPKLVAFRRWLEFENYRTEACEFIEYVAKPRGVSKGGLEVLNRQFDALCETLVSFPKVLSHFDFHAHNILVRDNGTLVVIDFQDACLVNSARDIASLLNDRGMDQTLGQSMHSRLLRYYLQKSGSEKSAFQKIYDLTLLHWDFRVSGRFHKLNLDKRTNRYQQWIPSTLERLGRTLYRAHRLVHGMEDLLEVTAKLCPEVRAGITDPWPFPQ